MPGLAGVASGDRMNNLESTVERMLDEIRGSRDRLRERKRVACSCVLGRVDSGIFNGLPQPVANSDGTLHLVLHGEIYGYADQKKALIDKGVVFNRDDDAEFVMKWYEDRGDEIFPELNGSYVASIWDSRSEALHLVSDRHGSRPVYYGTSGSFLAFGSEAKAVFYALNLSAEVDDRAVADFFTFGFFLENRTLFKGVELLSPGSMLTYRKGVVSCRKYWDYRFVEDRGQTDEEYVDEFFFAIRQAVERALSKEAVRYFLLSGGLDTRTVVACVPDSNMPINTLTVGTENAPDRIIAREVSRCLGTKHHEHEIPSTYMGDRAAEIVRRTDGLVNSIYIYNRRGVDGIEPAPKVLTGGLVGGELFGQYLLPERYYLPGIDRSGFLETLFSYRSAIVKENEYEYFFSPEFLCEIKDSARESFLGLMRNADTDSPVNLTDYFNFSQILPRFAIPALTFARTYAEQQVPFYDYDVVDLALRVPPRLRLGEKLRVEAVKKHFPELASITWDFIKVPLTYSKWRGKLSRLAGRTATRTDSILRRVSGNRLKLMPYKPPYLADRARWMRTESREYVETILLDKKALSRPYFNKKSVRQTVELHMNGTADLSNRIGVMLTFELWLREFVD